MARVELYSENSGVETRVGAIIYGGECDNEDYSAPDEKGLALALRQDGVRINKRQHVGVIPFRHRDTRRPATEVQQRNFWEAFIENNSDFERSGCLTLPGKLMSAAGAAVYFSFKSLFGGSD